MIKQKNQKKEKRDVLSFFHLPIRKLILYFTTIEINMTDFKIGQHVYEIFDPNNNGLVTQIDGDDIIVDTPKGKKKYNKSRIERTVVPEKGGV